MLWLHFLFRPFIPNRQMLEFQVPAGVLVRRWVVGVLGEFVKVAVVQWPFHLLDQHGFLKGNSNSEQT